MEQLSFPGIEELGRQALAEQKRVDSQPSAFKVTAPVEPVEFKAGERRAENQAAIVLEFFLRHPGQWFTPFEVHAAVAGPEHRADRKERWPLTSTRARMTTLTSRGQLRRCRYEDRRPGEQGMKNYTWSLVEGSGE